MFAKLGVLWTEIRDSLWFVPALLTVGAASVAIGAVQIDETLLTDRYTDRIWLFGGGPESARAILSSIAGSIITVTGVVFSVTIVALQLASSQFTPRVLRTFMSDRANQLVLGMFIGTFIYTLLVLRAVRSATSNGPAFVPSLGISVAILLTLASIAFLIFFIDHTARSIQASHIIDRATHDTLRTVDRLFPEPIGRAVELSPSELALPTTGPNTIRADRGGYLQAIDEAALFKVARDGHLTIRMEPFMGEFVLPGSPLTSVWPADLVEGDTEAGIRRAFVLGPERSLEQDLEFGITQLVDIAVKALSPSVNDPTTARICIDRLAEILVVLGNRAMPAIVRTDDEGRLLFVASRTSLERCVRLAFQQIEHYGAEVPIIAITLLATLDRISALIPEELREPLMRQGSSVLAAARRGIDDPARLAEVEQASRWLDERSKPTRSKPEEAA